MKKVILLAVLVIGVSLLLGGIYILDHPACCHASPAKNMQIAAFSHVSPSDFKAALESGKYKLIDVRTAEEYNAGHLKGASNIDYYQTNAFLSYLETLNKNGKYLIYCRTGRRSEATMQIMQSQGFTSVADLDGGYNNWVANGLPTL